MPQLYTPPQGTYDLPFTWIYDASQLTPGNNYPNQSIYLTGGYGDFMLRRIVDPSRILDTDGQFQIGREARGVYLQSDKVFAVNTPELAIAPLEPYRETSRIWFDLFDISLPANPLTAQLAFQGVRRLAGVRPIQPNYHFKPKTFTYTVQTTLTTVSSALAPVITYTKITDYDFELYNIMIFEAPNSVSNGPPPAVTESNLTTALWIYDQSRVQIANAPVLDIFYNGAPGSPYQNGAVVPPLFYPKDSTIRIDFYSLITNPALLPTRIIVYLIGRQLYPC